MSQQSLHGRDKSGYLSEDTIAALATGVGGAISVIRVSGPDAVRSFRKLASIGEDVAIQANVLKYCKIATQAESDGIIGDERVLIDEGMVVVFLQPKSFTGEDVVEFHLHGGGVTSARLLRELRGLGIRLALPGEFSFRAVRNGKMSITQAEAIADLISASNDLAADLALEKMAGSQNEKIVHFAESLRQLAALSELGIDFSDQDLDEVSLPALKRRLKIMLQELEDLGATFERGQKIQEGITAAFIGMPNAGKSSFFNSLVGEDRSIVSEIAGTTRDVIREKLVLKTAEGTVTLRIQDTAGLRNAENEIEKLGIQRSWDAARSADLVVWVVDGARLNGLELEEIKELWQRLGRPRDRTIGVIAKADLLTSGQAENAVNIFRDFGVAQWVVTSAKERRGISEAAQKIAEQCLRRVQRSRGEVLLTRMDHANAIEEAVSHLRRAMDTTEAELFAADIRQGLLALSPLIGVTHTDDVLGRIFSQFCIGK